MDYSLLVGIHNCKLYPRSNEEEDDDNDGDIDDDVEEGAVHNNGSLVEEDENSTDNNGDVSSEGRESSTPNSPGAKIDGQNVQKPIPDVRNGSGTNDSTSGGVTSSSRGDTQQTEDLEPQTMGAVSLPLPCPALVHGQKAVEAAKSDGKWPVVDLSVDKYAILSNNAAEPTIYFMAIIDVLTLYNAKKKAAYAAKTVKHGHGAEISTVRPDQYGRRFLEFLGKSIP